MKKRVLIVDDDSSVRDAISGLFRYLDCDTLCASHGEEGFEMFTENYSELRYGLVLTDWCMPRMNGIDLTKKIREYEAAQGVKREQGIKIAIATGFGPVVEKQGLEAGCDYVFRKPINLNSLIELAGAH